MHHRPAASWILVLSFAIALLGSASPASAKCAKIKPTRPGEVYLLRGLANIFSLGLDKTGKVFSGLGIENCVFNHKAWRGLADDIIERNRKRQVSFPIVIIGHSLGAGVAPKMATLLGKNNIEVSYVVMLDPVERTVIGKNVQKIVNYYLPKRKDTLVYGTPEFTGNLENVNVRKFGGFDHFNIDENENLRRAMYTYTLELSNGVAEGAKTDNVK